MKLINNYLIRNILLGFIGLVVITILINSASGLSKYSAWGTVGLMLVLAAIFGFLRKRTDKFVSGYVGESDIDRELKDLDRSFAYISEGLDTGRGNIDKIVIGPTGVWALEVKSHGGQFTFDGEHLLRNGKTMDKDFLAQAYAEAKTLQGIIESKGGLNVPVQPVVVFSNKYAQARLGLKQYKGVYVIRKDWLLKLITENEYSKLNIEEISKIKQALIP